MDVIRFKTLERQPGLVHGIFARRGGVSLPPFDSLNVGLSTGDDGARVRENRRRIARHLGFEQTLYLHQVHGREVAVVKQGDGCASFDFHGAAAENPPAVSSCQGSPRPDPGIFWQPGTSAVPSLPLSADGAVTDIPGLLLVIQVADCQAVVLYDPVKKVVANLHSGWRGSVGNILGRGVDVMTEKFGCDPGTIRAGISPSLGPCCAEFIHYKTELPHGFLKYRQGAHHFDFWGISRDQLVEKGMQPGHIEMAGICTRCHPDRFYSHRHARPTGRFAVAAGVAFKPKTTTHLRR